MVLLTCEHTCEHLETLEISWKCTETHVNYLKHSWQPVNWPVNGCTTDVWTLENTWNMLKMYWNSREPLKTLLKTSKLLDSRVNTFKNSWISWKRTGTNVYYLKTLLKPSKLTCKLLYSRVNTLENTWNILKTHRNSRELLKVLFKTSKLSCKLLFSCVNLSQI